MNAIEDKIWYHYNKCYKTAKSIVKCHDEACDIASESILRLLLILKSDNPTEIKKDPSPYINQIVFNICKNIKRKNKNIVPLNVLEEDYDYAYNYVLSFESFDLQKVMEPYPDEMVKLINMKIEGYSTKECADAFGINENSMKVRWHRIKTKLKSEFE